MLNIITSLLLLAEPSFAFLARIAKTSAVSPAIRSARSTAPTEYSAAPFFVIPYMTIDIVASTESAPSMADMITSTEIISSANRYLLTRLFINPIISVSMKCTYKHFLISERSLIPFLFMNSSIPLITLSVV